MRSSIPASKPEPHGHDIRGEAMTSISPIAATPSKGAFRTVLGMLWRDKFATAAVIFLLIAILCAILGPALLGEAATKQNLRGRNLAPFSLEHGWLMFLGADALGRPLLARIIVAAQNTLMIAAGAVVLSASIGAALGLVAGYGRRWAGTAIMRLADVIMSFPSLLLAVIVLYMLSPSVGNVILVLAITRIPIYLRTTRAEVLEIKERMFVQAAQVMGASSLRIIFRHILPMVIPTLVTIATLDFAFVMLAESALSFLGIGIQPPEITWGLMVAQGKQYLANAWWLAFWPGLAIILTTLSLNLLSNWLRIALDPAQRWRLEIGARKNG
jgi:peptide/nickel transport system permease protein